MRVGDNRVRIRLRAGGSKVGRLGGWGLELRFGLELMLE
jgi:hypothetical protein